MKRKKNVKTDNKTEYDKIVELSKSLFYTAKFSTDIDKCVEYALIKVVGNDKLSKMLSLMDMTKKDVIARIRENI